NMGLEALRLSYDINDQWRLTGRYTHDQSDTREPGGLFFGVAVPNVAATDTAVPGQVASVELRSTHGTVMNEAKYQFSSNRITTTRAEGVRNTRAEFGVDIPALFPANNADRIPTIVITGLSTFGASQGFNIEYFNHTLVDTLTWQRGSHTLKAGVLMAFEQKNEGASNETQGRFTFGNTPGGRTAFQNFLTGNADGLCGTNCTYSEAEIDITNNLRFNRYEMFVQDTWRAGGGLTIDYGLRYARYPQSIAR